MTDMPEKTMKPCPFCGGAKITSGYIRDGRSVGCSECGAHINAFNPFAEAKAGEKWNTRSDIAWNEALEAAARVADQDAAASEDALAMAGKHEHAVQTGCASRAKGSARIAAAIRAMKRELK